MEKYNYVINDKFANAVLRDEKKDNYLSRRHAIEKYLMAAALPKEEEDRRTYMDTVVQVNEIIELEMKTSGQSRNKIIKKYTLEGMLPKNEELRELARALFSDKFEDDDGTIYEGEEVYGAVFASLFRMFKENLQPSEQNDISLIPLPFIRQLHHQWSMLAPAAASFPSHDENYWLGIVEAFEGLSERYLAEEKDEFRRECIRREVEFMRQEYDKETKAHGADIAPHIVALRPGNLLCSLLGTFPQAASYPETYDICMAVAVKTRPRIPGAARLCLLEAFRKVEFPTIE